MARLLRRAVRQSLGARAVRRDLPEIEAVVENYRLVILRPSGHAEGGFLFYREIRFAVYERSLHVPGDVDDGARRRIHRPIMVVLHVDQIPPAGTSLHIEIVA